MVVQRDGAGECIDEVAVAVLVRGQFHPPGFEFLLAQAPALFGAAALELAHPRLGFLTSDIEVVPYRIVLVAFLFEAAHFLGRRGDGGLVVAYAS
ncbi:MAG: hypothetical protein J4F45_15050, partial [Pseudomonadales bacterium]|nr:hypothetical protein [Pseudomonadales bacterium]